MRTAWVTQYLVRKPDLQQEAAHLPPPGITKRPLYVDVKVKSVRQLAKNVHRLR
jgi:putative hydrolase of the HAD superfamily